MSDISLSKAVRSNLLSLQNTSQMMAKTQDRLATGNKVNSALDNPTNFFTASSLNSRSGDLNSLMDSMANGIQTLEAADNGLTAITKNLESMQSTLRQARQDKTFQTSSLELDATAAITGVTSNATAKTIDLSGGSIGTTPVKVDLANAKGTLAGSSNYASLDFAEAGDSVAFKIAVNGETPPTQVTIEKGTAANSLKITVGSQVTDNIAVAASATVTDTEMSSALTKAFTAAGKDISVGITGGKLTFTGPSGDASEAAVQMSNLVIANGGGGTAITAANFGFTAGGAGVTAGGTAGLGDITAKTVDQLVSTINREADLNGKVRASNDNGRLRIENQSTQELKIDGVSSSGKIDAVSTGNSKISGNTVRSDLAKQFNELRDQLDKLSDDASFNGINLLRGDNLKITFNETGTSSIDIQTKDGEALNAASLKIYDIEAKDLDSDADIDSMIANIKTALNDVRSQSGTFGSNLSIVQNRQDFTKQMINTLETGAANLTLADMNEEAANLLALQTRQSLSSSSLSLASQADQSVLQLLQ